MKRLPIPALLGALTVMPIHLCGAPDALAAPPATGDPLAAFPTRLTAPARAALAVPAGGLRPDGRDLAESLLRSLAEGAGPLSSEEVAAGVARWSGPGRQKVLDALMKNEVQLLGGIPPQPLGEPIDWFRAPGGDWQWPTHLSRHYWLLPLAYAWRATGRPEYAQKVVDVLLDWRRRTPVGSPLLDNKAGSWSRRYAAEEGLPEPVTTEGTFKGYVDGPWTALSAHARVDYWTQLFQLIWDAPAMTNANVAPLLDSLLGDHRQVMLDFPRQMNQYQGVASSLVGLGLYYPHFAGAAEAERVGWARLERHTRREVYPDGSLAECSPNYGAGMMRRLHRLLEEARKRKRPVSPLLQERLAGAARYFALTADPLGRSPRIAKGGEEVLGLARSLNAVAPDPEVAFVVSRGKEGKAPASPSASFAWAGHHVFRSGWDEEATWLFFDAGPRGTGHHDQAQLGVQLFANGEWLLTDPGYYSYSGEGEEGRMSKYLHGTAAHNAALVDGLGQVSAPAGAGWAANTAPGAYGWSDGAGVVRAEGAYTYGFGDGGRVKVTHRRRVVYDRALDTFTIEDRFEGEGRHEVALHWQFDPAARVEVGTGPASAAAEMRRTRLEMAFSAEAKGGGNGAALTVASVRGEQAPEPRGWFSAGYGKLEPATQVQVSANGSLPLTITSRLKIVRK